MNRVKNIATDANHETCVTDIKREKGKESGREEG